MQRDNIKNQHLRPPSAALIFDNGEILLGNGLGALKSVIAELCFNTSQTGYQETLTDPSYAKQIITFTFPHVGIVGTNNEDLESNKIYAEGCVINQSVEEFSNWRAQDSLSSFLKNNNIPAITGIDTRYLTRKLSSEGAQKVALIHFGEKKEDLKNLRQKLKHWDGLENLDLATLVSTKNEYQWDYGLWKNDFNKENYEEFPIVCLDFGIKHNILRSLKNLKFKSTILPALSNIKEILNKKPKGIFLSNGPGDPDATIKLILPTIEEIINLKIPTFGICLGHQLVSLALGAKTKKMHQGHRGANQPVKNLINNTVEITSQNHGFEVDRDSLPSEIQETHISLFDGSNEGIRHKNLPVFSVQYHPEASPGPHDSSYLFKEFYKLVKTRA
tara:strand:- start:10406 stop:11569 length:1164 start_codon:yes stop_codon:yes gene_type:complete